MVQVMLMMILIIKFVPTRSGTMALLYIDDMESKVETIGETALEEARKGFDSIFPTGIKIIK